YARRGPDPRRVRCRRQILRARGWRLRHLCVDGAAADPVPGRALWAAHMSDAVADRLAHRLPDGRWSRMEMAFWTLPVAAFFLLPGHLVLGSQILIVALFAL